MGFRLKLGNDLKRITIDLMSLIITIGRSGTYDFFHMVKLLIKMSELG